MKCYDLLNYLFTIDFILIFLSGDFFGIRTQFKYGVWSIKSFKKTMYVCI